MNFKNEIKSLGIKDIKQIAIKTLLFFALILSLFLIFLYVFTQERYNNELEKYNTELNYNNELLEISIANILDDSVETLEIITHSDEVDNYLLNKSEENIDEVQQLFIRMAMNESAIDQIRILDTNGDEVIRVNQFDNTPYIVSNEELQSKADSYYFQESITLNEGEYFVSPLDLNVENNVIEEPYKKIMRFSTPLYYDNNLEYILIVNIALDRLDYLFDFLEVNDTSIATMIVNEEGYYLYHSDPEQTFGWLIDNRNNAMINNDYAFIEDSYDAMDDDYIEYDGLVVHKSTIDPFFLNQQIVSNYVWDIINVTEAKSFDEHPNFLIWKIGTDEYIIFALILFVSISLGLTLHLRRKDQNELKVTRKISNETNDSIVISDKHGRISYVNKAWENTTGFQLNEVQGLKTNALQSGIHSKDFYMRMWKTINENGIWSGEVWNKRKDGIFYPKQMTIFALNPDKKKKNRTYISLSSELKDLSSFKYKINSSFFEKNNDDRSLIKDFSTSEYIKQFDLKAVIIFQIKNLHEAQTIDHVLRNQINSGVITKLKNKSEYISFISQITSELFVIGVNQLENLELYNFIENLLQHELNTIRIKENNIYLDVNSGISFIGESESGKLLIEEALIALEYCLENSNNKYEYFSDEIVNYFKRQMKVDYLLREAIASSELSMVYQPQIDVATNKTTGVEALIRWNSHEIGFVSPGEFIPVAEKSGYIVTLGYWIIEKVFIDSKTLLNKVDKDFRFAINISPLQFKDYGLVPKLLELSKKHGVPLNRFEIEITETLFADDVKMINEKLQKLRDYGVKVAVDDFGTGYSSLSYLQDLSIDKLKIDQSFISEYPKKNSEAILHAIISLGSKLNLDIICEGVETKIQKEYLQSIKCSKHQGYYYSKPVKLSEIDQFLS